MVLCHSCCLKALAVFRCGPVHIPLGERESPLSSITTVYIVAFCFCSRFSFVMYGLFFRSFPTTLIETGNIRQTSRAYERLCRKCGKIEHGMAAHHRCRIRTVCLRPTKKRRNPVHAGWHLCQRSNRSVRRALHAKHCHLGMTSLSLSDVRCELSFA